SFVEFKVKYFKPQLLRGSNFFWRFAKAHLVDIRRRNNQPDRLQCRFHRRKARKLVCHHGVNPVNFFKRPAATSRVRRSHGDGDFLGQPGANARPNSSRPFERSVKTASTDVPKNSAIWENDKSLA